MTCDMRRTATLLFSIFLTVFLSVGLVGCDETPTSVEDFEVQPALETPSSLSLVLVEGTVDLSLTYQGLEGHPNVETTGNLQAESANQSGSPRSGEQTWTLSYDGDVGSVVTEHAIVKASGNGRTITDTVDVTVSRFLIQSDFSPPTFAPVADFEERTLTTSGGTTAERSDMVVSENTTGNESLEISGSGTATIERTTSVPDASRFTFLIRPDESTDFTLTFSFTEETGNGTTTHDLDVQVQAGTEWAKYSVALNQIGADFNPVASRAGGNGALQSISMSTNQDVTYYVDDIAFASESQTVAEVHDFEETTFEYTFGGVVLSNTSDVAEGSNGSTARVVQGSGGGFGYNYDNLRADLSEEGYVSMLVNPDEGDELFIALEANDGAGGYEYGNGTTVTFSSSGWQTLKVPVTQFGDDPSAILSAALYNVGFEVTQDDDSSPLVIDDVQLVDPSN